MAEVSLLAQRILTTAINSEESKRRRKVAYMPPVAATVPYVLA